MSAFDLVVLGSGGGPCEHDLSAYLLKPHGNAWTDGIVALEAGSGIGALKMLLERDPHLFDEEREFNNTKINGTPMAEPTSLHRKLYDSIRCYMISHAHLDHVSGLILSAGSLSTTEERRRVFGLKSVLDDLSLAFSGRLWPSLASFGENDDAHKLLLRPLPTDNEYHEIFPDISARAMSVSHGSATDGTGTYESTAFFIRRTSSGTQFLFFGDVEPDTLSQCPRTRAVWQAAARYIPDKLRTLFIECSWPAGHSDGELYGHLSPEHLHTELHVLAREVVAVRNAHPVSSPTSNGNGPPRKRRRPDTYPAPATPDLRGALRGLRVYVIHCKSGAGDDVERPVRELITKQVKDLVDRDELGAEIICAAQGMRITI